MTFGKMTAAAAVLAMSGSAAFAQGIGSDPVGSDPATSMGSLGTITPYIVVALTIGGFALISSSSGSGT